MENHETIYKVLLEIKEEIGGLTAQVKAQNGRIGSMEKKVSRHEVFLGKVGVFVAGAVVLMTLVAEAMVQWFKRLF